MSRLLKLFRKATGKEEGITGLETAIILIAFVVVATVFAFVVLSTGLFSSERGKEAVYAGLAKTEGSLELRGAVIANTDGSIVDTLVFDLANAAGGEPVNLDPTAVSNKMVIAYRDANTTIPSIAWDVNFLVPATPPANNSYLLMEGELAEITVDITAEALGPNQPFTIEVKPPLGGTMTIARTTPAGLDTVVDLH